MIITVSGRTYHGACDPLATEVPREEGWPEPSWHRVGKGWQMRYEGDAALAESIASHLECLADGFSYSDDLETKAEARSFARDAAKIRAKLVP